MASPNPDFVLAAIHAAAERCPSSRHTEESAARLAYRTRPAAAKRSISANTSTSEAACVDVTRSGSAVSRWRLISRRAFFREAIIVGHDGMRVYQHHLDDTK
jgi:hypothetical protein